MHKMLNAKHKNDKLWLLKKKTKGFVTRTIMKTLLKKILVYCTNSFIKQTIKKKVNKTKSLTG